MLGEIENRVADNLAGAVIGDVAAAIGRLDIDVPSGEEAIGNAQMLALAVASEGDHVRMFAEEQKVGNAIRFARFDECTLEFESGDVGHESQIENPTSFLN
jgi:hypothetical protein